MRARARAAAAAVLALAGGAVAAMLPDAFAASTQSAAAAWLQSAAAAGAMALTCVVAANLLRAGRVPVALARAGATLGALVVLTLALGGVYFAVAGELSTRDSAGLAFIVAVPAAGAVVLGWATRRDGNPMRS